MGQNIAGKGKSTQNIAMLSIKSTSFLHMHLLLRKKTGVKRLFPEKLLLYLVCLSRCDTGIRFAVHLSTSETTF